MTISRNPPKPLGYANPNLEPPPRDVKETVDLFREPPEIARWTAGDLITWVVSFVVVVIVFLWLVARWWNAAWR